VTEDTAATTLAEAQRLLAGGEPFAAHEVLESAWRAAIPTERDLWRGLTQAAVAIEHARRGNRIGEERLRERAALTLEPWAGRSPYGVDIDRLRRALRAGDPLPPLA
jgi:predicted metal-dependent hydrolase